MALEVPWIDIAPKRAVLTDGISARGGGRLASLVHDKVPMAEILACGGDPGEVLTNPKTTDMIARSSANIAYRMMRYSGNVRGGRGR